MYTYNYQMMRKSRIVIAIGILWLLFNVFVLRYLAFYSIISWLVGVVIWACTVFYFVWNANIIFDNGVVWEIIFRRKYNKAMRAGGILLDDKPPRFIKLFGTPDYKFFRMQLVLANKDLIAQFEENCDLIAKEMNVAACSIVLEDDIRPIFQSHYKKPKPKEAAPDPTDISEQLTFVDIGVEKENEDKHYEAPLFGTHTLIAGKSGSGKGSYIWSFILGVHKFIRAGYVELWGVDPKRLELGLGEALFKRYEFTDIGIVTLLEEFAEEMQERGNELRGKTRKVKVSKKYPLKVMIIDELMYIAKLLPDTKLRARANTAIMTILVMGRAVGYICIAAVQDPRKDIIDFRDLFQSKIALWLDKDMTDLVLGPGMWLKGAHCDEIPPPNERDSTISGAGMGFAILENQNTPTAIRAHWQSDETIIAAANPFRKG